MPRGMEVIDDKNEFENNSQTARHSSVSSNYQEEEHLKILKVDSSVCNCVMPNHHLLKMEICVNDNK